MLSFPSSPRSGQSYAAPNGQIYVYDGIKWIGTNVSGGGGGTTTVTNNIENPFSFSVAADDSTQIEISNNELIKFIGAGTVTTSSDAEGYITITGTGSSSTAWADITGKPSLFSGSYTDLTDKPNLAGTYEFYVAADDSTQRLVSTNEVIKFIGASGITTASDAEGNITITQGATSSLVNGAYTLSLNSDSTTTIPGNLNLPGGQTIGNGSYRAASGGYVEIVNNTFNNSVSVNDSGAAIFTDQNGSTKEWVFSTDGTTLFPGDSIKNSLGSNTAITTQRTLTANNIYTNGTDFSTDVDLGSGIGVIAGWYQRNAEQIEFALFGPAAFISYLTGLALGRTVIVTYNTAGGTATLTRTLTQAFTTTGQNDSANPSWYRVGGRIDATLPVGELGIVSINFPVYSTGTNNWTFGSTGSLTFPDATVQTTAWTGTIGDIRNEGNINIDINLSDSTLRRWQFGEDGNLTFPDGTNYSGKDITLPQTINGIPNKVSWNFSDIMVGSTTTSLEWNLLSTTLSDFLIGTSSAATPFYFNFNGTGQTLGTIDNVGTFGGGKLVFGAGTLAGTGNANDIELKSTNNTYITADQSRWTFYDDNRLGLGASSGFIYSDQTDGRIVIGDSVGPGGALSAPSTGIIIGGDDVFKISQYAVSNAPVWTFKEDRSLNIPGDITSSGNIDIKINLSDSTMRRWSFGEDGDLNVAGAITLPNNGELRPSTTAYDDALADWENVRGGEIQAAVDAGIVTAEGWPMVNWRPTGPTAQGYIDFLLNAWTIQQAGGTLIITPALSSSLYQQMRALLINIRNTYNLNAQGVSLSSGYTKSWNFSETGALTIPGDIRSNTGFYVDVNLSDSTLHRWQFGEDGDLTFPSGTLSIGNNMFDTITSTNILSLQGSSIVLSGGLTNGSFPTLSQINLSTNGNVVINSDGEYWYFTPDGDLQIPGNVKSEGNINLEINLSDSTKRIWQFGEDGHLIFPGGTNILESSADALSIYSNNPTRTNGLEINTNSETNLFNQNKVQIISNVNGVSNKIWAFDTDGNIILPGLASITSSSEAFIKAVAIGSSNLAGFSAYEDNRAYAWIGGVTVETDKLNSSKQWTFGTSSEFKIPGGVHEKYQALADATGTVTHDCESGYIFYHTSPDANWTANFTNLSLSVSYATTVSLIITQGGTGYYPNAVQIGGAAQTINWQGNTTPTPSTNRTDVVSFSILRTDANTYVVLGQLTGF